MNLQTEKAGQSYWGLIILLATITALDAMSIDLYLPAFQQIEYTLQTTTAQVQNTLSVFFIGLALGQFFYGPLLDRYGRKRPLVFGCLLFTAGSLLAALASSIEILLLARLLQAFGASVGVVAPRAVVSDLFSVKDSAKVFSILMQIFMIIPVIAPILGAWILGERGWRSLFWLLTVAGAVISVWVMLYFKESLPQEARRKLRLIEIGQAYFSLFGKTSFVFYVLAASFCMATFFAYLTNASFIFLGYFALSELEFSYVFAAVSIGIIISGQVNTWLLRCFSEFSIVLGGFIMSALCGGSMLFFLSGPGLPLLPYIALLIAAIFGLGLTFGNMQALIMSQAGKDLGIASAFVGVMQYAFGAVAGLVIAADIMALPLMFVLCGSLSVITLVLAFKKAC